jgi:hypothetical protein
VNGVLREAPVLCRRETPSGRTFMIRNAFLLCAGIIAAACFACAPAPTSAPAPPPGGPTLGGTGSAGSATCPDGSAFLAHVKFVVNGYDASSNYQSPPPQGIGMAIDANSTYAQALQNAFLLAPHAFQDRLCGLSGIYVNGPTACSKLAACIRNSWGFRVWLNPKTYGNYIAISAGLWNLTCPNGSTYVYHCFETDLLNAVLGSDPTGILSPRHPAANAEADNFDMTILAALAHEVGHVQWYQMMSPNGPGTLLGIPTYDPNGFCGGNFFNQSWATPVPAPPAWRQFGQIATAQHLAGPKNIIAMIDRDVRNRALPVAASLLDQLHQAKAPWPSYFASISPDEDFVETYKFYVLTNAQKNIISGEGPLTSLIFLINTGLKTYKENIPDDYIKGNKLLLSIKTSCISMAI